MHRYKQTQTQNIVHVFLALTVAKKKHYCRQFDEKRVITKTT